jgi:hypothetical protein
MIDSARIEPYAAVALKLLREVVTSSDEREWSLLMSYQHAVQDYFVRIGLRVVINPNDGYAFLEQPETDTNGVPVRLPRLTRTQPLSAGQTLLLLLLRERLDEFLNQPGEADQLILSRDEMHFMIEPYLRSRLDQRRIEQTVKNLINALADMGLIKRVSADHPDDYVIERIIRAKFTSTDIAQLRDQIVNHIAVMKTE